MKAEINNQNKANRMMEMTQEWITQYNKKCAQFLEAKKADDGNYVFPMNLDKNWLGDIHQIYNMKFHSDWNWIMEVCFKISSLSSDVSFGGLNGRVFRFKHSMFWELIEDKNKFLLKIEEFIDWYNRQKES